MNGEKEITAAKVMEELREHETGCVERRKAVDQRFDAVDKRFDKTDENIRFWAIVKIGVLSLVMVIISMLVMISNN
ncbi:MAG: hypothetical protein OXF24_08000 [Hyphomicrobiales bacterium]|nr:hypothetical protein [Hyphomicrobiales bacterium]MCY4049514.1 hypothetical protein [Hyphomicrobiales bacterium]MCY4054163.1 hypothetical protein [Hyphomicrobiales bacterium]